MKVEYSELGLSFDAQPIAFFGKEGNFWGFLSFQEKSRYFGFSFFDGQNAYRLIADLNFSFLPESVLIHHPNHYLFLSEKQRLHFYFRKNGFSISQFGNSPIQISFDARPLFDNQPKRKIIFQAIENNKVKVTWFYQDRLLAEGIFLARRPIKIAEPIWQKTKMSFDQRRNSPPFEFENLFGLETIAEHLEFRLEKPILPPSIQPLKEQADPLVDFVLRRINHLFFNQYLPAGFPWFFERWHRDELISYWFLQEFLPEDWLVNYLSYYLNLKENIFLAKDSGIVAADVLLWLINLLPSSMLKEVKPHLEHLFHSWLEKFYQSNKINLPAKATWMDTLIRKDPIEISALLIKASEKLGLQDLARKERQRLQKRIFASIKEPITPEAELEIYRPNIFLVYQLLPDLFWRSVWRRIILQILEKLSLPWGGLASLSLTHQDFSFEHTGENPKSYHQGDSWHFLNALASKTLFELKEDKLAKKIFSALTRELFTLGVPGYIAELSSAKRLQSEGALVQTWSMSAFLPILFALSS